MRPTLMERLAFDDAVLTLVRDGDHRLSRPEDIERLIARGGGDDRGVMSRFHLTSLETCAYLVYSCTRHAYVYMHLMHGPPEFDECLACNCFAVRKAARAVTQHYDRALRKSGLRATQFNTLVVSGEGGADADGGPGGVPGHGPHVADPQPAAAGAKKVDQDRAGR